MGRENFPVGSVLIRRDLRPAVADFYRFARAADDAADDPSRPAPERLAALDRFEVGLDGGPEGAPEGLALRARLAGMGLAGITRHARQVLAAFRWDARGGRIGEWSELLGYCEDSANPVGRFLLDLHGEGAAAQAPADALCTALQILNHLQDIKSDHLALGRCYLPADWMAAEGAKSSDLAADALSPPLRRVADRALDRCDRLLTVAAGLPGALASRRLAAEATTILALARALAARLRQGDPVAGRVGLGRLDMLRGGAAGAWHLVWPRVAGRAVLRSRA